jgi:hypothetical protein
MTRFRDVGEAVADDLVARLTEAEAAQKHRVAPRTIRHWLTRGRRDRHGPYGEWARRVDRSRAERVLPPEAEHPLDREELLLVVSRSARRGNVQAMRLMADLLGDDPSTDPFDDLLERAMGRG